MTLSGITFEENSSFSVKSPDTIVHRYFGEMSNNNLVNVYSISKAITSILLTKVILDKGVSLDEPYSEIIDNWKGKNKSKVTIRHVLNHTSGLPHFGTSISTQEHFDWNYACSILKSQDCLFPPGHFTAYQARTFGFLAGMLILELTNMSLDDALFKYMDMTGADFHYSVPDHKLEHVIDLEKGGIMKDKSQENQDSPCFGAYTQTVFSNPVNSILSPNDLKWKKAVLPSSGGFSNAESIVNLLFNNVINDTNIFEFFVKNTGSGAERKDETLGFDCLWNLGFQVGSDVFGSNSKSRIGVRAVGGSICLIDLEMKMCFSYVTTKMVEKIGLFPAHDER